MNSLNRIEQVTSKIKTIFSPETLDSYARETCFIQRTTNSTEPLNFLLLLVVHMTMNSLHSLEALTDILSKMKGGVKITSQALSERMNKVFSARFLRRCLSQIISIKLEKTKASLNEKGLLKDFERVFLEDSTTCELHQKLASSYKGCGGSGSKAGYKINLVWEAVTGTFNTLDIMPSSNTDQGLANDIISTLEKDDLLIRDLGYYSMSAFSNINEKQAYFLSRLKKGVVVYTMDGEKIDNIQTYIDKKYPDQSVIEIEVLLGAKEKLPVRLITYRVPDEVISQRMRKKKDQARKSGTTIAKDSKCWSKFTFYITNVPRDRWRAEEVGTVYKLRWGIELIFKNWKSLLKIDIIKGKSKNRIDCIILGRIIFIIIMTLYFSCLRLYIDRIFNREISMHKFITWLLRNGRILLLRNPEEFEKSITGICKKRILELCKDKRSRLTSEELVQNCSTIYDLYPQISGLEHFDYLA